MKLTHVVFLVFAIVGAVYVGHMLAHHKGTAIIPSLGKVGK